MVGEITRIDMEEKFRQWISSSLDEEYLSEFKQKMSKNDTVEYKERFVRNATETTSTIREASRCNLFLVGRRPEGELALALRSECPELGPVGSVLAASDLSTTASVLVVQQYDGGVTLSLSSENVEEWPSKDSE